ncbi:MAG: hypothetical protein AAF205_00115 [Pseudomonadota bacterium]
MKPEEQLQAAVADLLRWRRDLWWTHPANEGVRHPAVAQKLKRLGMRPGAPDILGVRNGRLFAVELKAGRNTASEAQRQCLEDIARFGGAAGIARTPEEVMRIIAQTEDPHVEPTP